MDEQSKGPSPEDVETPTTLTLSLRKLKVSTALSDDTLAFTAEVLVNGVPAFTALNRGTGGPNEYHPLPPTFDPTLLRQAEAWAAAQPPIETTIGDAAEPQSYPCDLDQVVDALVFASEEKKWYKRHCAKKTLFRLKGEGTESWHTINTPFSTKVKEYIIAHYEDLLEIANETRAGQTAG